MESCDEDTCVVCVLFVTSDNWKMRANTLQSEVGSMSTKLFLMVDEIFKRLRSRTTVYLVMTCLVVTTSPGIL